MLKSRAPSDHIIEPEFTLCQIEHTRATTAQSVHLLSIVPIFPHFSFNIMSLPCIWTWDHWIPLPVPFSNVYTLNNSMLCFHILPHNFAYMG